MKLRLDNIVEILVVDGGHSVVPTVYTLWPGI
jgi:hypothetical protein